MKILEITQDVEKVLVDILDTYLKAKGISGNNPVNMILGLIKVIEQDIQKPAADVKNG